VIFRKVTGCFRSQWGAEVYAAASVIATGRIYGLTALQALRNALASLPDRTASAIKWGEQLRDIKPRIGCK
jgi:hypothetical protein